MICRIGSRLLIGAHEPISQTLRRAAACFITIQITRAFLTSHRGCVPMHHRRVIPPPLAHLTPPAPTAPPAARLTRTAAIATPNLTRTTMRSQMRKRATMTCRATMRKRTAPNRPAQQRLLPIEVTLISQAPLAWRTMTVVGTCSSTRPVGCITRLNWKGC